MIPAQTITTRDRSSGRYHARFLINGRQMVDERCNLDDAGLYDVVQRGSGTDATSGIPEGTDPTLLCAYCFPHDPDDESGTDSV